MYHVITLILYFLPMPTAGDSNSVWLKHAKEWLLLNWDPCYLRPMVINGVDILYNSVLICFHLFAFQIGPPKPRSMSIYKNDISNLFTFFLHTIGYELRLRLDYDNSQCPLIGTTLRNVATHPIHNQKYPFTNQKHIYGTATS